MHRPCAMRTWLDLGPGGTRPRLRPLHPACPACPPPAVQGRFAAELSTGDELVLTEMVFAGKFKDLRREAACVCFCVCVEKDVGGVRWGPGAHACVRLLGRRRSLGVGTTPHGFFVRAMTRGPLGASWVASVRAGPRPPRLGALHAWPGGMPLVDRQARFCASRSKLPGAPRSCVARCFGSGCRKRQTLQQRAESEEWRARARRSQPRRHRAPLPRLQPGAAVCTGVLLCVARKVRGGCGPRAAHALVANSVRPACGGASCWAGRAAGRRSRTAQHRIGGWEAARPPAVHLPPPPRLRGWQPCGVPAGPSATPPVSARPQAGNKVPPDMEAPFASLRATARGVAKAAAACKLEGVEVEDYVDSFQPGGCGRGAALGMQRGLCLGWA